MAGIIGGRTCRTCEHRTIRKQGPQEMVFCRRYPPTCVVVMGLDQRGNPISQIQSSYPCVDPNEPCGEYRRNELFADKEVAGATVRSDQ